MPHNIYTIENKYLFRSPWTSCVTPMCVPIQAKSSISKINRSHHFNSNLSLDGVPATAPQTNFNNQMGASVLIETNKCEFDIKGPRNFYIQAPLVGELHAAIWSSPWGNRKIDFWWEDKDRTICRFVIGHWCLVWNLPEWLFKRRYAAAKHTHSEAAS